MRYALLLVATCMSWTAFCVEDISEEVTQYLREHSSDTADDAWREKMHAKFKEKLARDEFYSSEEAVADDYVMTWLEDHHQAFDDDPVKRRALTSDEKLEICRAYCLYFDNNWKLPKRLAAETTKENFRLWIDSERNQTTIATVRR